MFSLKTKLLFFLALTVTVVIVVWLYSQQSYSAFDLNEPGEAENSNAQNPGALATLVTLTPTVVQETTLTPTATSPVLADTGCTLPLDYWVQNQEKIPPQILIKSSTANQAEVCVNYAASEICTNLGEFSTDPDVILRQQFLVAIINYLAGADPGAIGNTINDAYEWLRLHLSTAPATEEELQAASLYAQALQSYNQGEIGPGACEVEVIPVVPEDTATLIPVTSGTTATLSPTMTGTPTVRSTVVIVVPTSTEPQDQEPEPTETSAPPPPDTQPVPSDTSPPQPTNTEIPPAPPTEPPTPTPVQEIATPTPVP